MNKKIKWSHGVKNIIDIDWSQLNIMRNNYDWVWVYVSGMNDMCVREFKTYIKRPSYVGNREIHQHSIVDERQRWAGTIPSVIDSMGANKPERQTINKYLPKNSRKSQQSWWMACGAGHSKFETQVAKTCGGFRSSSAYVIPLTTVLGRRSARNERETMCHASSRTTAAVVEKTQLRSGIRSRRPTAMKRPTDETDSVLTFTTTVLEEDGDDWLWRKKIIGLFITARAKNGLRPLVGPANRRQSNDATLRHRGAARPRCDHGRNQKRSGKRLPPLPPPPPVCGTLLIIIIGRYGTCYAIPNVLSNIAIIFVVVDVIIVITRRAMARNLNEFVHVRCENN